MSKCREAFEKAVVEHIGPEALAHGTMSIYQAAEIMWKAAWNARGKVDAEIARTPVNGEQDDITMAAKDRIAEAIEKEKA